MRNNEKMAIKGWEIWSNIIRNIVDIEKMVCFVIIEEKEFTISMIDNLLQCYINTRKINSIYIISNFYDEGRIIHLVNNVQKIQLSEYEINCLLAYYSIWQFTDQFYVFSFNKMDRQVPDELCEELSKFERAAAGILKLKRDEINAWYGRQNCNN